MTRPREKPPIHGRDHMPGGADPVPGIGEGGSGGGGIQFDTYPQSGHWLHLKTTGPGNAAPGSNAAIHIESNKTGLAIYEAEIEIMSMEAGLGLYSRGRMGLTSEAPIPPLGDPRPKAEITLNSDLAVGSGVQAVASMIGFIAEGSPTSDAYPELEFHLSNNNPDTARGALFRVYSYGEVAVALHQYGAPGPGDNRFAVYADTNSITAVPIDPIFTVDVDGSVHIKSGTSIIADL